MKPQVIVIAGIKRSGSTIQYNLVRLALEMAGYEVLIRGHSFDLSELDTLTDKQVILCKRHPFHEEMAEKAGHIFLTDRKDEEIIASLTRFNGNEPYEGRIADMRKHLDKWKEYSTHSMFHYRGWKKYPSLYASAIINCLGVNIDRWELLEAFNELEPPESGQDPESLLFHNHITSK